MHLLSLDTSAATSVALLSDGVVVAERHTTDSRRHAEILAKLVQEVLAEGGCSVPDAVAVGTGPGPFTGLRVGIAAATTFAWTWKVPLHGVMSLHGLRPEILDGPYLAVSDARRKEVYWALFEPSVDSAALVDGPHVGPASAVPHRLPAVGQGALLYPDHLAAHPDLAGRGDGLGNDDFPGLVLPSAVHLGQEAHRRIQAGSEPEPPTPHYLRGADAQVPGPRKKVLQ